MAPVVQTAREIPRRSFVSRQALLLTLALSACANVVALPRESLPRGGLLFNGYENAKVQCFSCHNGDGTGGGRGSDLSVAVPIMSAAAIIETIDEGPGAMPSYKDTLSAEEKQHIVEWLQQKFPPARKK